MIGAIAGDICGSPYEGGSCLPDDLVSDPACKLKLFAEGTIFTDDTVCTVAVAEALLTDMDFSVALRRWASKYPGRGYGGSFIDWVESAKGPYNSFGNGGAMRVSPCALLARSIEEAEYLAGLSASVTHNHPEGLRGAKAIAGAIWLAKQGGDEQSLRLTLMDRYGYDLLEAVASRAKVLSLSTRAIDTVPTALACALEAKSWEDSVSNAIWIGGDSDTVACMAGGIAEARFGLPPDYAAKAFSRLPPEMQEVMGHLYAKAELPAPWVCADLNSLAAVSTTASQEHIKRTPEDCLKPGKFPKWLRWLHRRL